MLNSLEVDNFALIDHLRVDFAPGFNVFTGETGAGKSILIDAFSIVLGSRASVDYLRKGADAYWIQAVFDIEGMENVHDILRELDLDLGEDTLFLRRKVTAAGKSQAFVNERQVPVYVLSRLASHLVDIHGQHENQTLLAPGAALTILDHLDPGLPPLLEKYQEKFVAYDKARETVKKWLLKDAHQTEDLERLEGEIQEIDEARIQPGEDEKLRETVRKLSNQEKILQAVGEAHHYLEGGEDSLPSALDAINTARSALEGVLDYAPELKTYADSMDSAWETLEDVRQSLGDILAADHEDRETLEAAQERLDQLYRLKQKYGGSLEEVLAYRDRAQTEYEGLLSLESTLSRLRKQEAILKAEMQTEADKLTAARKKAAARLVEALLPHIRDLAMPEGRVDLQFTRLPECHGRGQDNVQFLFSANAGMDLKPLGRIASGGELSRFALALKTVMMKKFGVPTMIFDDRYRGGRRHR